MTQDFIFSTRQNTGVVFETTETLDTSAMIGASDANVLVTRTSGSVLSIFNGASSSAIQTVRFNPITLAFTAAVTLTIASGSGTGVVTIGARLKDDGTAEIYVEDTSGCTFSGTPVIYKLPGASPHSPKVKFWKWTITSGAFDSSGGTSLQPNENCWLDVLDLANTTGSAATVTVSDAQSTARFLLDAVSIAGNTTTSIQMPGGRFFQGGVKLSAGTANAIDAHWRGSRARQSGQTP